MHSSPKPSSVSLVALGCAVLVSVLVALDPFPAGTAPRPYPQGAALLDADMPPEFLAAIDSRPAPAAIVAD